MDRTPADGRLRERERELGLLSDALSATEAGPDGGLILIEGPAGIGKSALLGELQRRAAASGVRVLKAIGSEMEKDFGFGVLRQLLGRLVHGLNPAGRERIFAGPVALTAAIFGLAEAGALDPNPSEASLYGLFWLVVRLAESGPLLISIDDAHWADPASLRFIRYLGHRLEGLPLVIALAARPNEPGIRTGTLDSLRDTLTVPPIRPALLSRAATTAIVRERLGASSSASVEAACHEVTGGNPLLIETLLAEPCLLGKEGGPISPEQIGSLGPEQIGASLIDQAARIDRHGPRVLRAVAIMGDGSRLRTLAALAELGREQVVEILDAMTAAAVLGADARFAHPLLRTAVYESIPPSSRREMHRRASQLLGGEEADVEAVAAHLLLCGPGREGEGVDVLEAAAERAAARGAPESVVSYLRCALPDVVSPQRRSELLHRLGRAEVALREPESIEHLREAAALSEDPEDALELCLELVDALALAGAWEAAVEVIDAALGRFEGSGLPGLLDLEAVRAAARGYDPAVADDYAADTERLLALARGATAERSRQLRWVLSGIGACRDMPRDLVLELIGSPEEGWSFLHRGRESSLVFQVAMGFLAVEALGECERLAVDLEADARRRGSVLPTIGAIGIRAALDCRRGRLAGAGEGLLGAIEVLRLNGQSVMVLTTVLHVCLDAIVERRELEAVAELIVGLDLPPAFAGTASGAMALEVRGAVCLARGDRRAGIAALREAGEMMGRLEFGPRFAPWRSRLALALPDADRAEALKLATEERDIARELEAPRAEGVALRALGLLRGGEAGIELLRRSVELERGSDAPLELARSLTELGACLRRSNQRKAAREPLLEASDLAQRCGAGVLGQRAWDELRATGAKPRRRALSGPEALTPSERRVALAAAAGATNREIGRTLFISMRTVEMHLTSSYRKLGIATRTELGDALATPTASETEKLQGGAPLSS